MSSKILTFLLFTGEQHGKAEEAVNFYTTLFDDSEISSIEHYGPNDPEPEGTVKQAHFSLNGQRFIAKDSHLKHKFDFNPAISFFIESDSAKDIEDAFKVLAKEGVVFTPLEEYPFSPKFGWVQDKYGISWQLSLVP
ncbi:Glyoxalase superfamily enzyme, possibly 3-demethylubiquinone-9 3-methyltransferase [Salinimicrobium catena]|uniref:Glyoxalase superfamily enzyme, possibly 3-demethylubiquinone-9 3-methyltransferase n=1 Tax=Salinimicrobium catena TaxID=390640 RepID=A0A1H5MX93_9FLAO|nr:VOC family protein [Salinimicrobium catena]SDL31721.1 Glyoxalase superfamily enzyme, possibly 3-demethylubiquinone-9 3-methyltransferase [Salinimicrobium catena]SEE93906.1 Glyoxalase superfamily enzyme, possibly 3-demethylubiquinone-9 3-methyltransferase [Salinimicrobium catena]